MKTQHSPHHWVAVALVLAAALLTLSEAHGQQSGAAAQFEARPAMAGATTTTTKDNNEPAVRKDVAPARDKGLAKDQRSTRKKASRAVKRTISRARHGNAPVDSSAPSK